MTHFITISEAIKQKRVKHLNVPEEKITVTPLRVDDRFKAASFLSTEPTLSKYGLKGGSYVLRLIAEERG